MRGSARYREVNQEKCFKSAGKLAEKKKLAEEGMIHAPFRYISCNSHKAFGIDGLPEELYSSSLFADEFVTMDQIFAKIEHVEQLLRTHGYDISFNLYVMENDKVHTKIVSPDAKTVTINRVTSPISVFKASASNVVKRHVNTYNLLLKYPKDAARADDS